MHILSFKKLLRFYIKCMIEIKKRIDRNIILFKILLQLFHFVCNTHWHNLIALKLERYIIEYVKQNFVNPSTYFQLRHYWDKLVRFCEEFPLFAICTHTCQKRALVFRCTTLLLFRWLFRYNLEAFFSHYDRRKDSKNFYLDIFHLPSSDLIYKKSSMVYHIQLQYHLLARSL